MSCDRKSNFYSSFINLQPTLLINSDEFCLATSSPSTMDSPGLDDTSKPGIVFILTDLSIN